LYREIADCEPDPRIADLFRTLAGRSQSQAEKWRAEAGGPCLRLLPSNPAAKVTAMLARRLGPRA